MLFIFRCFKLKLIIYFIVYRWDICSSTKLPSGTEKYIETFEIGTIYSLKLEIMRREKSMEIC